MVWKFLAIYEIHMFIAELTTARHKSPFLVSTCKFIWENSLSPYSCSSWVNFNTNCFQNLLKIHLVTWVKCPHIITCQYAIRLARKVSPLLNKLLLIYVPPNRINSLETVGTKSDLKWLCRHYSPHTEMHVTFSRLPLD